MKKLGLFLVIVMLAVVFAGCSSHSAMDSVSGSVVTTTEAAMEMPEESVSMDSATATGGETVTQQVDYTEKIIYSASLYLETTDFDAVTLEVEGLIATYGGFVESSHQDGNTAYNSDGTSKVIDRFASYTLRIPSENFDGILRHAGTLGNVVSSNRLAENITSAFSDQEALRTSLEIQEARLLEMMEQSQDIETLIALEARVSEVRFEIDSITRQLTNWQRDVDYSTVEIAVQEVEVYTPTVAVQRTFGEKLRDSFQSGLGNFAYGIQSLVLFAVANFLQLIVFAIFLVAFAVVFRKIRRKKNKIKDSKTDETP